MQLIIKDGVVVATHEDYQDIAHLYPDAECILWDELLINPDPESGFLPDPRTDKQKKDAYLDKRRTSYPSIPEQLDMMYHDNVNATTVWVDAIGAIKANYPKPAKE